MDLSNIDGGTVVMFAAQFIESTTMALIVPPLYIIEGEIVANVIAKPKASPPWPS